MRLRKSRFSLRRSLIVSWANVFHSRVETSSRFLSSSFSFSSCSVHRFVSISNVFELAADVSSSASTRLSVVGPLFWLKEFKKWMADGDKNHRRQNRNNPDNYRWIMVFTLLVGFCSSIFCNCISWLHRQWTMQHSANTQQLNKHIKKKFIL